MSNDNWSSPTWILDLFKGYFDPCPLNHKINGLKINWKKKNYVNPPYSKPKPWIEKAIEENKKGKIVVMLLPVDTTTKWFSLLINAKAHVLFFNERLSFNNTKTPARWGNMLVILE